MDERWQSIQNILMAALEVGPDDRPRYVRTACRGDQELVDEVNSLLSYYEKTGVLDRPGPQMVSLGQSPPGSRVAHYEILERLEVGGMGVVYKARDTKLGRLVALKFLLPHIAADDGARDRLVREAQAASALDHPNICTVYEVGETEDHDVYIAMAFYDGKTLDEIIDGTLPLKDALDIVLRVGQGLAHAHEAGIVHRDIKPANIFLTDRGRVKILDFGIAKVAGSTATESGSRVGTLAYMSPEQLEGMQLDRRTDVWSLGVVLYELVTGARPFLADQHGALIRSILESEPSWPSETGANVPRAVQLILQKALRKDRDQRYQRVEDFVADLEIALAGVAEDGASGERLMVARPVRRWSQATAMSLLSFLAVAVVIVLVVLFAGEESATPADIANDSIAPDVIAVFPFADGDAEPVAGTGTAVAREFSRLLFDAGVVTSVDYNTVLTRSGQSDVLNPRVASTIASQVGGKHFVLGTVDRSGNGLRVDASLYDETANPLSRFFATTNELADAPGATAGSASVLADALLHQFLSRWNVEVNADHIRYRRSLQTAAQTTKSGAALKEFVLAFYAGDASSEARRLQRAIEIDSTFAMASFLQIRRRAGSERARSLLVRYRHKLPPVEQGLTEIYTTDLTFEEKRRKYVDLLNSANEDGALWEEYGDFLFVHGYKNGRRTVEALRPLMRASELNGFPWFLLADIGLLERDLSLLARQVEHDLEVTDATGRHAYWFDATLRYAAIRDDSVTFDRTLADYKRVHPMRLDAAATRIAQYGKETTYPRRVARLLMTAPDLTEDWIESGRYIDAQMDLGDGRLRRGTQKLLALADDNPAFIMSVVGARIAEQYPDDPEFWSEVDQRLQRWDTLAADWPLMAPNPHAGSQEELKSFLRAVVALRQNDMGAFETSRDRVARSAERRGRASTAAAMVNTLDAWMLWRDGDGEAAWQLLDRAQRNYAAPDFAYHSWVTDQMLDRYLRAEIRYAAGEYDEALTWYLSVNDRGRGGLYGMWAVGPTFFLAGDIYERLGDTEAAINNYRRLIEIWAHADPELQHYVVEAQRRLDHLIGV